MKKLTNKKRMVAILIALLAFTMGNISVNAQVPTISIRGENHLAVTGTTVDGYTLTIDYSEMTDLTNFVIRYRVNDGAWQNVNYSTDRTTHTLIIRGGTNGLTSGQTFQTIYVYAENDFGKTEELEKRILVIYFANRNINDPATGITAHLMRFPLGTEVEIERVTDPAILSQIPLLNMTVYRVTPKVNGIKAGPLLREFGLSPNTHYITLTVPIPENIRSTARFGRPVGWVFPPNFSSSRTASYFNNPTVNFTLSTSTFIYNEGSAFYVIASGIDPNHSNIIPSESYDSNDVENPETGAFIPYILIGTILLGTIGIYFYTRKKNKIYKI